jgi:hypothetical protein
MASLDRLQGPRTTAADRNVDPVLQHRDTASEALAAATATRAPGRRNRKAGRFGKTPAGVRVIPLDARRR